MRPTPLDCQRKKYLETPDNQDGGFQFRHVQCRLVSSSPWPEPGPRLA